MRLRSILDLLGPGFNLLKRKRNRKVTVRQISYFFANIRLELGKELHQVGSKVNSLAMKKDEIKVCSKFITFFFLNLNLSLAEAR